MALSQNGYSGLPDPRYDGPLPRLRRWVVPDTGKTITSRDGSAGFLLIHLMLWIHETLEAVNVGPPDDGSYNYRSIRGYSALSNHASATAIDINWNKHPLAAVGTFSYLVTWNGKKVAASVRLRYRLRRVYKGCIRWGGEYHNRKDEMHFELVRPLADVERVARHLMDSPRGKRILEANPGAKEVILS